jgi:isoquinoline 1-oxidoreductase subunit alpha
MSISLKINGQTHTLDAPPEMPLLWVVREMVGLTGTKYSCGIGHCGACTMLLDGKPVRSCITPLSSVSASSVTTIEGLALQGVKSAVQQAWLQEQVPQCGYCQSGVIMAVTALINKSSTPPTDAQIDDAITNICRCGTYPRIRAAIHRIAKQQERQVSNG